MLEGYTSLGLTVICKVNVSQFFFSHLPSVILVATTIDTINSMRYIVCPCLAYSDHVT